MSFSSQISKQISQLSPSHIVIGYSGGVDSTVILDICSRLNIPTIAIHINHSVNKNADNWQKHCHNECTKRNVSFLAYKLDSCPKGESFEAWASKERMKYFRSTLLNLPSPLLILGHHQDDQAETFLIQAIRGAGVSGLSGMPKLKTTDNYKIFRPLLAVSRDDIEKYAKINSLSWVHDDSNDKTIYRRNYIRHKIIPTLKDINPSISKTLSRSANLCAKSNNILNKLLEKELLSVLNDEMIVVEKLTKLDIDIQESLVHLWFKRQTTISLKANQVHSLIKAINNSATTGWSIDISGIKITLEYGLLGYYSSKETVEHDKTVIYQWLKDNHSKDFDINKLTIRDRLSNDKCRYIGRNKDNKLKILFQELEIPSSKRHLTKIIEFENKIVAVYPFFICI